MPIVADGALPNEIYIGKDLDAPLYTYTNNELSIGSIKGTFNCDIISNELPIDTFTFGVYYDENQDRVYLTNDTRQAYVCKVSEDDPVPIVPGTLESCGWASIYYGTISDNDVHLNDAINARTYIMPPESVREGRHFIYGDKLEIHIKATEVTKKLFAQINKSTNATISSSTGLFDVVVDSYNCYFKTTQTGEDVLTIEYNDPNASYQSAYITFFSGNNITPPTSSGTASFEITGILFNGEAIYGRESAGMIYVLSRRGNVPAKRYLKDIKYGTPVFWFCDSNLQGKGYLKTVERTGTNTWKLTSMSAIGLLDEKIHPGGYYTGQTFDEVVQEIVGDSFPYEYAPGNESIAELAVFGWLPYDSARNNLHRLLFAMGAVLKRVDNQGG